MVPHMGWNDIAMDQDEDIWKGIRAAEGFYFLHSYAFYPDNTHSIIALAIMASIFVVQ